jgi:hypothetical protein
MYNNASPLEYLASFAITFAAGMATAAALSTYSQWLQKRTSTTTAPAK